MFGSSRNRCLSVVNRIARTTLTLIFILVISISVAQDKKDGVEEQKVELSGVACASARKCDLDETNPTGYTVTGLHRITLEEAQQQAAAASPQLARLGQLQVEAARQHRLAARSDYFPKLTSIFANLHFNKFMGQQIAIQRPILLPNVTGLSVPLLAKDETVVGVMAAQPLTSLLKVREAVRIAKADENIARAKAGMPVSEIAEKVEKTYYELLIAQRKLILADFDAKKVENKRVVVNIAATAVSGHERELVLARELLAAADNKVKELTASLNNLMGWPNDVQLTLDPPPPFTGYVSLDQATAQALTGNPEIIEAEQTLIKARAASKLSKLAYIPDFAAVGGYAYQTSVPLLPNDFSWIGVIGSFNLFDFGKREHSMKERKAQVEMAETALQLARAKVAAGVKSNFFELERARRVSGLAHRLASEIRVLEAADTLESAASKAALEAEMFQADLECRQAFARLNSLMGNE